ncbi:MAG: TolC family protein [Muribaculaceae bacterium]|nr:TolC family protein [Muribaculaceae bacterium]
MHRFLLSLCLPAVTCCFVGAQTTESVPVITLDQCIEIALSENPTVRVADMDVQRTNYARKETLGTLLPSISFSASYNRMLAKQVAYMNMDDFSFGGNLPEDEGTGEDNVARSSDRSADKGIKMGLDNSYQTGFSASVPLIAPQLWQALKLSDAQIMKSVEQARVSRQELVNQVKCAYYALLLAQDSRKVVQQSYDMAALTHSIYSDQFDAGAASEYDVLRTSVAMKNIEPEIMQADISISRAQLQLKILMGLQEDFSFSVTDSLPGYNSYVDTRLMEYASISNVLADNPSLRMMDIDTEILKRNVKVQKASLYPTLALTGSYSWTSSNNGTPFKDLRWNPYSIIGVTLSFPLFEGGQRYNRIRQAQIQVDQMQWQRENLERSVMMQIELAMENLTLNRDIISSSRQSVMQAEKAHDIMDRSFKVGAASYLDLRDSELALTRARLAYNQAIYNYLVADSELELLLGTYHIN